MTESDMDRKMKKIGVVITWILGMAFIVAILNMALILLEASK